MDIVEALTQDQISQLHSLYVKEWWTNSRTLDQTANGVIGSQLVIGVIESNNLVGFARVLTDYTFKALIFDLIIDPRFRKLNVGDRIINHIKNHKKLSQVAHFELYCLPELFDFYRKYGFDENVGEIKLMRYVSA